MWPIQHGAHGPVDPVSIGWFLGDISRRVETLEDRQKALAQRVDTMQTWARRLGLLAVLWTAAIGSHMQRDQAADLIAAVLRQLIK